MVINLAFMTVVIRPGYGRSSPTAERKGCYAEEGTPVAATDGRLSRLRKQTCQGVCLRFANLPVGEG